MPDNRIRFSAEFASTGADQVKRDLEERFASPRVDDAHSLSSRVARAPLGISRRTIAGMVAQP